MFGSFSPNLKDGPLALWNLAKVTSQMIQVWIDSKVLKVLTKWSILGGGGGIGGEEFQEMLGRGKVEMGEFLPSALYA